MNTKMEKGERATLFCLGLLAALGAWVLAAGCAAQVQTQKAKGKTEASVAGHEPGKGVEGPPSITKQVEGPPPSTGRRATAGEIVDAANSGVIPAWFSPEERKAVEKAK